jgi:hypothetical protein
MTYFVQIDDLVREATAEETKQIQAQEAEAEAKLKADAERAKLKADTLAKLGLTADEVAALLS